MKNAVEEYHLFLTEYLLPLMGVSIGSVTLEPVQSINRANSFNVFREDDYVFFLADRVPYFKAKLSISDDNLRLARRILTSFMAVSHYKLLEKGTDIQNSYLTDTLRNKTYDYAIQHGICAWITGTTQSYAIDRLLGILERWSIQTYEGRKVTFGFIINSKETGSVDWLDFLEDDYSATLTDCIHSVIELDEQGKLIRYNSLSQDGVKYSNDHGIRPYRFSLVLDNFVTQDKVGVFLLINGDIIISKNRQVRFVKRNLKWLNMSYEAFINAIGSFTASKAVVREVYASMLDVSFSHTGGIIAIVNDLEQLRSANILSPSDDIKNTGDIPKQLGSSVTSHDLEKRLLKRRSIHALINHNSFCELDRKLRAELIAMDGACIISPEGEMLAVGAIIQNESGSSGGGRGAACKRLSKYGVAIKISTDGYIEMFKSEELIYSVK